MLDSLEFQFLWMVIGWVFPSRLKVLGPMFIPTITLYGNWTNNFKNLLSFAYIFIGNKCIQKEIQVFAVAHFLRHDIFMSCGLKNSVWLSQVNHASQQHTILAEPTKALMKNWAYYSNINKYLLYDILSSRKKNSVGIKLFKKGE